MQGENEMKFISKKKKKRKSYMLFKIVHYMNGELQYKQYSKQIISVWLCIVVHCSVIVVHCSI